MNAARYGRVDALRGLAVVWMTAFHFCFDLNYHGFWRQNFLGDPFWTLQRTAIVGVFLFCAGLGQAIAVSHGQGWSRFWRRWTQVAACALLVTAGSWWMFPHTFIYFGVLHGVAVMLVIARLTAGWGRWLWPLGAVALALPPLAAAWLGGQEWSAAFNGRALNWLGLVTHKPFTEDYVPVLPWIGVVWWGMAAGQAILAHRPAWMAGGASAARGVVAPLAWLGRHSLPWYMLHQPVLLGLVGLAASVR